MSNTNKPRKVLQFNMETPEEVLAFELVLNKLQMQDAMENGKIQSIPNAIKSILEKLAK
jgi:hypothetical protein